MITVEEFRDMLDSLIEEIPEKYFIHLNGGIGLREELKIHPKSIGEELKIMGEYSRDRNMGRSIWIYYGSFMACYGYLPYENLKCEVRKTLHHELLHHLEFLAGYKDLEIEDAIQLNQYLFTKEKGL